MLPGHPTGVITSPDDLQEIVRRALAAEAVAVDVEANGLFAYRARACVVQLAWVEAGELQIALVDSLAVPVTALSGLLSAPAPLKVFHDLAFDARLFLSEGVILNGVRDTSVAAQLCGHKALGLSSLLLSELGISIDKRLQQNDWSRRPLSGEELVYLAGDVAHLLDLDRLLLERAASLGVLGEIADDSEHKLRSADRPPRDPRPSYVRARGSDLLDTVGRAVLRRLFLVREAAAEARDVPPVAVAPPDLLVEIARRKPRTLEALPGARSLTRERTGIAPTEWLAAVAAGIADGDVPEEERRAPPVRPDRVLLARRRVLTEAIAAFRREEAARRGVDEQVVLPGRCSTEWVEAVMATPQDRESLAHALRSRVALGPTRHERYFEPLLKLAETV